MRALLVAALLVVPALALAVPPGASKSLAPADFLVGFGSRSIDPDGQVNLGGFGFGCCRVTVAHEYPTHVRAIVVGDGAQTVAMASLEVQGSFAAYADGAFGQYDVAKRVEAATQGKLPRSHIIISSDHSHRGADTTGAWGGVSDGYLAFLANQTAGAILDAYAARAPAHLRVAEINETAYVTSDFSAPNQDTPDGMFRLLFAERPDGSLMGAYGTFAAHATLHGSAPLLSPDWPGIVSDKVGASMGGVPVVLGEGAIGRTHPAGDRSTWEDRIAADIVAAYASSAYLTTPGVQGAEAAITLNAYNAILMEGLLAGRPGCSAPPNAATSAFYQYDGGINPACVPIARSSLPPWMTGNRITTLVTALRIGDVMVWGAPGELYPNAQWTVQQHVSAPHVVIAGLANDQLGYLISPSQDWYKIASNPTSDNTLFNVDVTGGDHVACAAIALAPQIGFAKAGADPTICALWAFEDRTLPS